MTGSTLVRPRPADASKSAMENVLELIALKDLGPVSTPAPYYQNPISQRS